MKAITGQSNLELRSSFNSQEKERKLLNNSFQKSDEENQKIKGQLESIKFYPLFSNVNKRTFDSFSVCASQGETLSQTSESSFILSHLSDNSQNITTKEIIIQNDKKEDKIKDIPFYYGYEEYFKKLQPDKFIDYTKTKNYVHKNNCLKEYNTGDLGVIINEDFSFQENVLFQNYYFPESFPINDCSFIPFYNNNNRNRNKKGKIKQRIRKENKSKKINVIENDEQKHDKNGNNEEMCNIKKSTNPINKEENIKNTNHYFKNNYKQRRNKESNYYKNSSFYKNNYQRNCNKYSNYYYDENDFYEERRCCYYNNNYQKRKYEKRYENKKYCK